MGKGKGKGMAITIHVNSGALAILFSPLHARAITIHFNLIYIFNT